MASWDLCAVLIVMVGGEGLSVLTLETLQIIGGVWSVVVVWPGVVVGQLSKRVRCKRSSVSVCN